MAANVTRRGVLSAAGAGAAAATAGCFSRLRSRVAYTPAGQAELTIKCVPADRDPAATAIARSLRDALGEIGVGVTLELLGEEQLVRDALLNHEFELAVVRVPVHREPDELRAALHSRFAEEEGWQNPFGVASPRLDALAERQRRSGGDEGAAAIADLQRTIVREQPIAPVVRRPYVTATADGVGIAGPGGLADGLGYLVATPVHDPQQLNVTALTPELTVNRNPLSVEFRTRDRLLHLLYDPLARRIDGEYVPWLAESWTLERDAATADGDGSSDGESAPDAESSGDGEADAGSSGDAADDGGQPDDGTRGDGDGAGDASTTGDGTAAQDGGASAGDVLSVRLRPDLVWHDDEPLTAEDVAFTYRFLRDTALGETDSPVPAPRFRSQSSLVTDATAVDDRRTVELELAAARPGLVPYALTVPILPEHHWRERSELGRDYITQAMLDDVTEPVGSGPLRFADAVAEESVTFRRFDDHFLRTADDLPDALAPFRGGPTYDTLEVTAAPNVPTALSSLQNGDADVVDGAITPRYVSSARDRDGVQVREEPPAAYYALWFNCRRPPLSHYGFRTAVARLLDREHLAASAFDGLAEPTEAPLADPALVPDDLEWDGTSAAGPFPGEDGEVDVEAARQLFRDAGFRFHDGELLARE